MEASEAVTSGPGAASLVVIAPGGHRSRVAITPLPFTIGRQTENRLVLRDSRASRSHARIVLENGSYIIEDVSSRHGTFVNGQRVTRHALKNSDRIEFGVEDSYQLIFTLDSAELKRMLGQIEATQTASSPAQSTAAGLSGNLSAAVGGNLPAAIGGNLPKLRALLDLALTLQGSFSINEVLTSVVDTALTVTGAERGFLLLRSGDGLDTRVARNRHGNDLDAEELRVPRNLIRRALEHRRELLSMNFDPLQNRETQPQNSIADLELRSVICVPLVRIRAGQVDGSTTNVISTGAESVGVLYMDSRAGAADLAGGNRELLQALAIEASTILENARLLEEERAKQQMDEELRLARTIQQSLLPKSLPDGGWIRARGSSIASREVGGDYFDVAEVHRHCWSAVVADVSGKGVSSALLASLLQGALITASAEPRALHHRLERLNRFLYERTGGEKYATIFYCLMLSGEGGNAAAKPEGGNAGTKPEGGNAAAKQAVLHYINAAHCPPLLFRASGAYSTLEATGLPVGLVEDADFALGEERIEPGDRLIVYSDGVTEAQNPRGEFFGGKRLREVVAAHLGESCTAIHDAIHAAVAAFTEGAPQSDDITVLVLEFETIQPVIR